MREVTLLPVRLGGAEGEADGAGEPDSKRARTDGGGPAGPGAEHAVEVLHSPCIKYGPPSSMMALITSGCG